MEPASLTTWLQPLQFTTQSIKSVWKCQVLFRILQTFKNLNFLFIGQMIKSQSEKCLAQNESNISVGVDVESSLIKVKDTHLMNDNQPVAEILCWRLRHNVPFPISKHVVNDKKNIPYWMKLTSCAYQLIFTWNCLMNWCNQLWNIDVRYGDLVKLPKLKFYIQNTQKYYRALQILFLLLGFVVKQIPRQSWF